MPQPPLKSRRPWIIAHRGARMEAPENTAAAFDRAMSYRIDGIEFDVQMSTDGVALLHHDRTLKKVAGIRRRVAELPWEALRTLDAGAWFDPVFAGEPLVEFDRVLQQLAGRTRLFIEIKVFEADRRSGRAFRLTDAVLEALAAPRVGGHRRLFHLLSFDPDILRYAGERAPDLKLVLDVSRKNAKRLEQIPGGLLHRLCAVCVHVGGVSVKRVDWAHARGKRVFAYTCNDAAILSKLLRAGVDGILTDRPGWLAAEIYGLRGAGHGW